MTTRRIHFYQGAIASLALASAAFAEGDVPAIANVVADNRGQVELELTCPVRPLGFGAMVAQVTTSGPDNTFFTDDDVLIPSTARLRNGNRFVVIESDVPANMAYRVVVNANTLVSTSGSRLDGEFNGMGIESGDGSSGGDFEFFSRAAAVPVARFTIENRAVDVELFTGVTPRTVENFLDYANDGEWDGTFFHRLARDFVIQGGGFRSNFSFDDIPSRDPVVNEPGISNLRGTIAMAKLGGDPNSATNQWFFNLVDNSANLDSQNGGFTVFGEIMDEMDLLIIDSFADLDTVNASSTDSAFSEVPVLDAQAFDDRGGVLAPEDVVEISRVAILVDIASEPNISFNTDNALVERDSQGDAEVMAFDLSGDPLPSGIIEVSFSDRGNTVDRVTLMDSFPTDREIALSISSERPVREIRDRRRNGSDLMFIHSNAPVRKIDLRSGITGANLNGIVLPDGSVAPIDIDGDGNGADKTAILIQSGELNRIDIQGDVEGDIVSPVAPESVRIRGDVKDCTLAFERIEDNLRLRVEMERAENLRIDTPGHLHQLKAYEIVTTDNRSPSRISALFIGDIRVTGDRRNDVDGDFECTVVTTGGDDPDVLWSLGRLEVAGDILNSQFMLDNDVLRDMKVRGRIVDSDFNVDGSMGRSEIRATELLRTNISVLGDLKRLRAAQARGGALSADTIGEIRVDGERRAELDGDFTMDVLIDNPANVDQPLERIRVAGDLFDSMIVVDGDSKEIRIDGDMRNVTLDNDGDLSNLRVSGRIIDTDVTIEGDANTIEAVDWNGGSLRVEDVTRFQLKGDRREDIPGDLSVEEFLAESIYSIRLQQGGSIVSTVLQILNAGVVTIEGDMIDSEFFFNELSPIDSFRRIVARDVEIRGDMVRSFIRSRESFESIEVGGMFDSGIFVGRPTANAAGFPDTAAELDEAAAIEFLRIGNDFDQDNMENSFVVCAQLGRAFVARPREFNPEGPFGLSYTSLEDVITVWFEDSGRVDLEEFDGSFLSDSFQVRSFHQEPVLMDEIAP